MSIEVRWGDETHTYIDFRLIDPWDWDQYQAACDIWRSLVNEVDDKVCIILDFTETAHLPRGALAYLQKTIVDSHPKTGVPIIVGANPLIRSIINTVVQLYPITAKTLTMVATHEDAMDYIKQWQREGMDA
jgi:hypothetical protein